MTYDTSVRTICLAFDYAFDAFGRLLVVLESGADSSFISFCQSKTHTSIPIVFIGWNS
jgi:hypothetical protein